MSWAQVDSLAAQGHEIAGHTLDHTSAFRPDRAEQRRQICDDAAALRARGYNDHRLRLPLRRRQHQRGCARGPAWTAAISRRARSASCTATPTVRCLSVRQTTPAAGRLRRQVEPSLDRPITLADLEDWVTDAESHGGGWLPLMFHDICDNCIAASVSPSDFSAFLTWLARARARHRREDDARCARRRAKAAPTTTIACNGGRLPDGIRQGPGAGLALGRPTAAAARRHALHARRHRTRRPALRSTRPRSPSRTRPP